MSDQKILPDDLEDPNLYTKQGKLYQGSGNFGAAIACYENAIRINSNDVDAHYELGHLYRSVGEYQQSIFFYSNVTRIDPNQIEVHNELGTVTDLRPSKPLFIDKYLSKISTLHH